MVGCTCYYLSCTINNDQAAWLYYTLLSIIYIYLANVWSSHVHQFFLKILTLIREKINQRKKKGKLTTSLYEKIRLKYPST
jgi:hypothetical protein